MLHLAPDASAQRAARGLATARPWRDTGHGADPPSLWGLCAGSGAEPYQTCVDLTEPAYRCSCPSRKLPCKHALALMLLWSAGAVESTSPPPEWVTEWLASRADRQAKCRRPRGTPGPPHRPRDADSKTVQRRADRVEAGLAELDRWLTDQVRQGIAGATRAGYAHWDTMAARLVDAQAPALASSVRRLASVADRPRPPPHRALPHPAARHRASPGRRAAARTCRHGTHENRLPGGHRACARRPTRA